MRILGAWLLRGAWISWLEVLLVAALAAVLGRATWLLAAPRVAAEPAIETRSTRAGAPSERTLRLFGAAAQPAQAGADERLRLVGVVAPGHVRSGAALFSVNGGKARAFAVGETIADGVALREVHPEHAVVARDGAIRRIPLERKPGTHVAR